MAVWNCVVGWSHAFYQDSLFGWLPQLCYGVVDLTHICNIIKSNRGNSVFLFHHYIFYFFFLNYFVRPFQITPLILLPHLMFDNYFLLHSRSNSKTYNLINHQIIWIKRYYHYLKWNYLFLLQLVIFSFKILFLKISCV